MSESDKIRIPSHARGWRVNQLPVTTRLRTILRRGGRTTLGTLHGLTLGHIADSKGCGVHSLHDLERFLRRLHAGEFEKQTAVSASKAPRTFIKMIDDYCTTLDARDRRILLLRMGVKGEAWTLDAVGQEYGLTRERVRQITDTLMAGLSRHGGPPLIALVRQILNKWSKDRDGLTTDGIAARLKALQIKGHYPISFYAGAISHLRYIVVRQK